MNIYNLRLGHACNSSSTHSIVPLSTLGGAAHDDYESGEFGWSHFMLASAEAKMEYLAATLADYEPTEEQIARISAITGVAPVESEWNGPFGSVNHQSRMSLPLDGPYAELFLQDLAAYLRRDDVVVLGGNDNGGRGTVAHLPLPIESAPSKLRPGRAPDGSRYWTVMDSPSGDRIRFSFAGQPLAGPGDEEYSLPAVAADPLDLPYADAPELVNLKVTGFCPFERDCPFCYMASTNEGAHADRETALAYLGSFAAAGVFEVALGGGEPTLWPHLAEFVAVARLYDINVNLTTKNIAWLAKGGLDGVRAIAVSLNNRRDLDRFTAIDLEVAGFGRWGGRTEITVQCVPAFCDDALLADIVAAAQERALRVTFLGVKRTGRASDEERRDDLRWMDALAPYRDHWWLRRGVAVDTLMASASAQAFADLGIDPVWYETTEGKFSCYVDATEGGLGASSYVADGQMLPLAPGEPLEPVFKAMQTAAGLR